MIVIVNEQGFNLYGRTLKKNDRCRMGRQRIREHLKMAQTIA